MVHKKNRLSQLKGTLASLGASLGVMAVQPASANVGTPFFAPIGISIGGGVSSRYVLPMLPDQECRNVSEDDLDVEVRGAPAGSGIFLCNNLRATRYRNALMVANTQKVTEVRLALAACFADQSEGRLCSVGVAGLYNAIRDDNLSTLPAAAMSPDEWKFVGDVRALEPGQDFYQFKCSLADGLALKCVRDDIKPVQVAVAPTTSGNLGTATINPQLGAAPFGPNPATHSSTGKPKKAPEIKAVNIPNALDTGREIMERLKDNAEGCARFVTHYLHGHERQGYFTDFTTICKDGTIKEATFNPNPNVRMVVKDKKVTFHSNRTLTEKEMKDIAADAEKRLSPLFSDAFTKKRDDAFKATPPVEKNPGLVTKAATPMSDKSTRDDRQSPWGALKLFVGVVGSTLVATNKKARNSVINHVKEHGVATVLSVGTGVAFKTLAVKTAALSIITLSPFGTVLVAGAIAGMSANLVKTWVTRNKANSASAPSSLRKKYLFSALTGLVVGAAGGAVGSYLADWVSGHFVSHASQAMHGAHATPLAPNQGAALPMTAPAPVLVEVGVTAPSASPTHVFGISDEVWKKIPTALQHQVQSTNMLQQARALEEIGYQFAHEKGHDRASKIVARNLFQKGAELLTSHGVSATNMSSVSGRFLKLLSSNMTYMNSKLAL